MLSVKIQFNHMLTLRKCVLMSAQRNGEADMRNAVQLVDTAVRVMKAQGSDIPELPRLAAEAVRFLEYDTPATSIQGKERRTMTQVKGELRVKQSDGMEFVAKKGDVWTCKKRHWRSLGECRLDRGDNAYH
jgi:hypothetical protein